MYLKLAWRNIWRNKKRTAITLASVFFAVVLSTLMMSIKEGTYVNMIDSMVGSFTGHIQIHKKGYWAEKTLDNGGHPFTDELKDALESHKGIKAYSVRIESFALAASEEITKGVMVAGIDPETERINEALDQRVAEGAYFTAESKSVMLGDGLAKYLELSVGDTVILLGQGYHGVSAAGKYPVQAIVKFGSPELSNQFVFLPIQEARALYGMEGLFTNIVLQPDDPDHAKRIAASLQRTLGDEYEVMDWEALIPELKNMIETDRVEGYVFMFILYMVVSFGIFGTILMMMMERYHEFGVVIAIGMKRVKLAFVVWMETMIISIMGALLGIIGALPVCAYFHFYPIRFGQEMSKMYEEYGMEAVLRSSIEPEIFLQQAAVIAVIASVIAVYPFLKLTRMQALEAMNK